MDKISKIALESLLFLCILDMPYGYFQLVRFAAFVGFGILTYHANQQRKQIELIIFGAMALLYQPFLKIILRRELWNNIDEIIDVGLMVRLLKKQNDE